MGELVDARAAHGGAAGAVHESLLAREPVTSGFGHLVHRHGDPRVAPLLDAVYAFATGDDRARVENARQQASAPPNSDLALGALTYAARMPAEEYDEAPLRFRGHAVKPRSRRRSAPGA